VKYLKYRNLEVPILGNVYVVSLMVAKLMNKNLVPGCVVTDEFLKKLTEEAKSPDKGKQARLERAGQLVAIFKGLGFNGVHIGGFGLKVSDVEFIINRAREIGNGWRGYLGNFQYPQKDEFYLFPPDDDFSFAPEKLTPNMGKKFSKSPSLQIMKLFHNLMFESIGYQVGKRFYPWLEKRKVLDKVCHQLEKFSKQLLFDCQDCGDCALPDLSYLCPMSRCAKFQRNGPCGGSYQGWCEVYPDEKKCVWTLIYQRLAGEGKLNQIREEFVPPADGKLIRTSSWGNFFLGRDHTSKKLKELKEKK
jgi:methylenetetrahydrofolate reductase (NADPH)